MSPEVAAKDDAKLVSSMRPKNTGLMSNFEFWFEFSVFHCLYGIIKDEITDSIKTNAEVAPIYRDAKLHRRMGLTPGDG